MITRLPLLLSLSLVAAQPAFATDATLPADPGPDAPASEDPVVAWQEDPTRQFQADEVDLEAFRWIARPVVVFADTPADPRFREQVDNLTARPGPLADRDVVVILDADPDARSSVRKKLRPRGFMLAIIAKDGTVNLRKPLPWDVREITRSIDKMPMRKEEIRARQMPDG